MHKDCVFYRVRVAFTAVALGMTVVPPSAAGEMWYARAVRGFDLPITLPDPIPVALEPERIEARPSQNCAPPAQHLLWTLEIDETEAANAMLPISLYHRAPRRAARLISNRLDAVVEH